MSIAGLEFIAYLDLQPAFPLKKYIYNIVGKMNHCCDDYNYYIAVVWVGEQYYLMEVKEKP